MKVLRPRMILEGHLLPWADEIERIAVARDSFREGEVVYGLSSRSGAFSYYIESGWVACVSTDEDGSRRTWSVHGAGIVIPLYYSMEGALTEAVLAFEAIGDVKALRVPKAALGELLRSNEDMAMEMIDAWMAWCTNVFYRLQMVALPLEKRICTFMLMNASDDGSLALTHETLAESVDATRESVSRVMANLAEAGAVRQDRGLIEIVDRDVIAARASYVASIGDAG